MVRESPRWRKVNKKKENQKLFFFKDQNVKDKDNRQRLSICLIDTHYFNYAKGQIS